MKRNERGFTFRAIVVEAMGALVLLVLLFPMSEQAASTGPASLQQVKRDMVAPTVFNTNSVVSASPRVPRLSLPAPPVTGPSTASDWDDREQAAAERRAFVVHELEYSRRALVLMLKQHVQQLVYDAIP